jgi:hypothetical protein
LANFVRSALLIAVPVTIIATVPTESGLRPGYPAILAFPLIVAVGAIGVLSASAEAYRLFRIALRAAKAGYGWGIIAEVLVDRDRNAGALITGDREFAMLTTAQRNAIRRSRVLAAGLAGVAGLWALSGFLITLPVAARLGGQGALLTVGTLGIPLALLGAAGLIRRREKRLLEPIRSRLRKHRSTIDRLSQLAQTWREAFDRAIADVGRGQGAMGRIARRVALVAAASVVGAAGIVAAAGLAAIAVGNEATQNSAINIGSVREKLGRVSRLRSLRLPQDASITPSQAGHALHSIASAGATGLEGAEVPPQKRLASLDLPAADPFKGTFLNGNAIRQARVGFTREERDYLERVAALPGREEVAVLARAQMADFFDVSLKSSPDVAGIFGLPLPRYSRVKAAANAHVARAALALADGRATEAERLLREDIGMGFVLMEGPTVLENLIGAVIVGIGRSELVALYEVTGRRAEARAISAETDPVRDPVVEATTAKLRPEERDAFVSSVIRDETAPRGVRWEFAAVHLAYQPCSDLGQVLFGPSEQHRTKLEEARRLLVRTPGEEKLMRLAERALETPPRFQEYGMPVFVGLNALMRFARTVDGLTGSRRMESCMTIQPF